MLIEDILQHKGRRVIGVAATAKVADAIDLMAREEIGAVVVLGGNHRLLGVISEREIVASVAARGASVLTAPVERIMITTGPVAAPEDRVSEVQQIMTARRARHMPVVVDGKVVGVVSIGDIVQSRLQEKINENGVLRDMARAHLMAA